VITVAAAQVESRAVVAVHMSLVQKNIHRGHLVDMQLMPFKISVLRRNSELLNTSGTQNYNLLFIDYRETHYRPKQHTQGGPCWHVLYVLRDKYIKKKFCYSHAIYSQPQGQVGRE
jgi:hypothetical protein